jgi:hypothetical protein
VGSFLLRETHGVHIWNEAVQPVSSAD